MAQGGRGVEVFVVIATTGAGSLLIVAVDRAQQHQGAGEPWFLAAAFTFLAAVLVPGFFFGLHPLFESLDKRRTRILVGSSPQPAIPRRAGKLNIIHAEYGGSLPSFKDVTGAVRALIANDTLDFVVANELLGGDPEPDVPKVLKVQYSIDGIEHVGQWYETTRVQIPPPNAS